MRIRLMTLALVLAVSGTVWSQTFTINTFAGGGLPEDVPALSAGLGSVAGSAIDAAGNVYVALPDYNVIVRRGITGILERVAGTGKTMNHDAHPRSPQTLPGERLLLGRLLSRGSSEAARLSTLRWTGGLRRTLAPPQLC